MQTQRSRNVCVRFVKQIHPGAAVTGAREPNPERGPLGAASDLDSRQGF